MKKGVIYGAGGTGSKIYDLVKDTTEIIAFVDSDSAKWGGTSVRCR